VAMKEADPQARYADRASLAMIDKAEEDGVSTVWDRLAGQSPQCKFGATGVCCRNCNMGPCRIIEGRKGHDRGVCGATAATIAARNWVRMVAAGAAAHSDHGRGVAETLLMAATGKAPDYQIKDTKKLRTIAECYGVKTDGREPNEIAAEVAETALHEFGKPEGTQNFLKRAPEKRQKVWADLGVMPRAVDREICETLHRTHIGVDQEYRSILKQGIRCSLGDGWGGSMIGTELQDILFGTPIPGKGMANLGVLKEDEVNIVVHGHEPILSEMIVLACQDPELVAKAKKAGASGINIAGICCTANELLLRHGIPIAGNVAQQELALATGAVDVMAVDIQCIYQSVGEVASKYHTKIITTSPKAHMPFATHIEFEESHALDIAKEVVEMGIDTFKKRGKVRIPQDQTSMVAGFSHEAIEYMLGGTYRASYRPLNDNIMNGRIRGLAGVVGCTQPKVACDVVQNELVKELIKHDILVVQTGCMAISSGKAGFMQPEYKEACGPGLREVCETVGMPPVLHSGSCVDNSRILIATSAMVAEGGLGDDISDLPVAGSAPEWMSEKAISIGQYFVSSGVFTVFGISLPITGSKEVTDYLCGDIEKDVGGKWAIEPDPKRHAEMIRDHIESKRDALGINEEKERVLFDMEARRELAV